MTGPTCGPERGLTGAAPAAKLSRQAAAFPGSPLSFVRDAPQSDRLQPNLGRDAWTRGAKRLRGLLKTWPDSWNQRAPKRRDLEGSFCICASRRSGVRQAELAGVMATGRGHPSAVTSSVAIFNQRFSIIANRRTCSGHSCCRRLGPG